MGTNVARTGKKDLQQRGLLLLQQLLDVEVRLDDGEECCKNCKETSNNGVCSSTDNYVGQRVISYDLQGGSSVSKWCGLCQDTWCLTATETIRFIRVGERAGAGQGAKRDLNSSTERS